MEVLEPLWTTMTVVHDLVKAHNDLGGELAQLGETVKLISLAVKPLLGNLIKERETQEDSDTHNKDLFEVFTALRQVLEDAEKTLKQLDEEKKSRFYFLLHPFRPQSHIEEIKCYLEKLKTLTPILTLAINSQQHHSKGHHEPPNNNNSSFSASKMLKNESSKDFWVHHFGDKEYAVSWSRFIAALSHEFSDKFLKEGISLHFHVRSLKNLLDKNGDDEIDIYEYDQFTSSKGLYQACFDLFKSNNNQTSSTDKKRKSDDTQETSQSKAAKTEDSSVMGPPTSPAKRAGKENENSNDDNNTKEEDYAYQLVLIGKQGIISQQCFKDYQVFRKPWSDKPFTIGRADFAQLPAELLVRISRLHFEIQCKEDSTTSKREFWLKDMSGNGTYVNGKHVGHTKTVQLEDGDRIGILMAKPQLIEVEFGYLFKIKPSAG